MFEVFIYLIILILLVGTLGYNLLFEMPILDALYNSVIILTTLGPPSVELDTTPKYIFNIIYILISTIVFISIITFIVGYVIVHQLKKYG